MLLKMYPLCLSNFSRNPRRETKYIVPQRTCDLLWGDYPMLLLLFQGRIVFQVSPDGLPYHGVLAHENFSSTTQRLTDLLHLFGPYIVHTNQKHLRKFIHVLLLRKVHLKLLSKLFKSFYIGASHQFFTYFPCKIKFTSWKEKESNINHKLVWSCR